MKKLILLFLFPVIISCYGDGQKLKNPPKDDHDAWYYEPGLTIADIFPEVIGKFGLTSDELQVVGDWGYINDEKLGFVKNYVFYPNKTCFMSLDARSKNNEKYISDADGIWRIRSGYLEIKIKRIGIISYNPDAKWKSMLCDWKWQKIIKIKNINPDGYSIYPFQSIKIPSESGIKPVAKYINPYMFRSFREPDMATGKGYYYTYFNDIGFQAKMYPDGTHIYDNEETYKKYLADRDAYFQQ